MDLYRHESSNPKTNAQRNLQVRTHYVDDDTLRFHKSRILSSAVHDNGLLFSIVESVSLDFEHTHRGFRHVIFDVFGTVISRLDLDQCFKSRNAAAKALYAALDEINAVEHTRGAIIQRRARLIQECDDDIVRLDQMTVK